MPRIITKIPVGTVRLPKVKLIDEPDRVCVAHHGLVGIDPHNNYVLWDFPADGKLRPPPGREVELVKRWLDGVKTVKTKAFDSYRLKHIVEDYVNDYIGHGSFILACGRLRIPLRKREWDRCEVLISKRWLARRRETVRP